MSVDYTVAAIPTMYRGRQYRSRLEARWAAFFTILGWEYEHEPFDLGKWSPDFMLTDRVTGGKALAEVKPIQAFDEDVGNKIVSACFETGWKSQLSGVLLLHVKPTVVDRKVRIGDVVIFGEGPGASRWIPAELVWILDAYEAKIIADIVIPDVDAPGWHTMLTYRFFDWPSDGGGIMRYPEHTERLWSEASNAVRWQPPRK